MKKTILTFIFIASAISLSSCGGGGDGGFNPTPGTPAENGFTITLNPVAPSLPANTLFYPIFGSSPFLTQVSIRVQFTNGQIATDGTIVNLTTSNADVGFLTVPDDGETDDVNEFTTGWITQNEPTVGGIATFFLVSGGTPGNVTYTASASTGGRSYSGTLDYTITEGPDPTFEQLTVELPRTTLPVNNLGTPFFNGTPFMMEADIQFRDVFGNVTNPAANNDGESFVTVSINPVTVAYFSILDDPETEDINEFFLQLGQGPVDMNSGHGNLFLWSQNIPGTATVTVSAIEAGTGFELSTSFDIEIVDGLDPSIPSDITLVNIPNPLYVNGSGGDSSQNVTVNVSSGNIPVLDPQVNNVSLSIITDSPNSGEKLTGINASGTSVEGTSINIATVNGIANALINSGNSANTITLTTTADRADNNVDNGIQDGISDTTTYIVSDGVLWALELTSPALDALTVNGVQDEGGLTYDFQDGTYSLILSAIGTDKSGNPALPQTVQFGMINSPITGYPESGSGGFVIAGLDGDPQEGGTGFTSISGAFVTAAGGAQPGDTLMVFGEESLGNEDLESAVTVSNVNSQTSLNILELFNRNDETGTINNDLGILPYAIGRAVDGNISATAVINNLGVATTTLNYPVSQLGRIAAISVKGQGAVSNGVAKSVTDVELTAFPGVEGFNEQSSTLVVSPNNIPANRGNIPVTVCIADSARNALPGRNISFVYVGGNGVGTIDGQANSGVLNSPTGLNGCTTGIVSTTGVIVGGDDIGFDFFSGNLTCTNEGNNIARCLEVSPPANAVLNANPSAFIGGGIANITLTLYDGSGNPISGAALSGSCTQVTDGFLSIASGPTITDINGQSEVTASFALDAPGGGLTGTCTFETANGEPSVDVHFSGRDSCILINPSPVPPANSCDEDELFVVGGTVTGLTTNGPLVLENDNDDPITITSDTTFSFPPQGDGTIYLISVATQPPGQTCSVVNGAGTVSSNVTDVMVTCN